MSYVDVLSSGGGGSGNITSINGDTTAAQVITMAAATGLTIATSGGTSTVSNLNMVSVTYGATVTLDASAGSVQQIIATGDCTLLAPSNPPGANGTQKLTLFFRAQSATRTLSLTTGSSNSFAFGTDVTALTGTTGNTVDIIGFIYNSTSQRWLVAAYVKGF